MNSPSDTWRESPGLEGRPETRREVHHVQSGPHSWEDPYRWLEDDSEEVAAWSRAQDACTRQALTSLPHYEPLRARLETLLGGQRTGRAVQAGKRYFHRVREIGAELWSLWVSDSLAGPRRLLIDPSIMAGESPARLAGTYPSPSGRHVAFQLSHGGSSLRALQVMDVDSGRLLEDVVPAELNPVPHLWHSANRVAWTTDERGFYYSRCPQGAAAEDPRYHQKIYCHRLGDDYRSDELIFGDSLAREKTVVPYLSEADQHLIVSVHDHAGTAPSSEVHVGDARGPGWVFRCCLPEAAGVVDVHVEGQFAYIKHQRGEPYATLARLSLEGHGDGAGRLEPIIAPSPRIINRWLVTRNAIILEVEEDGAARLEVHDHAGTRQGVVELETFASIRWMSAMGDGSQVLFSASSPLFPPETRLLDLATMECTASAASKPASSSTDLQLQTVWFSSADGTRIRMHLLHRKGLPVEGKNPTIIRAYGGFGVSLRPRYRADVIPFVEQGGVYAEVNVRGGGEFGESWHRAGMRDNKQNCFDDLIAAGEWLIERGYTSADHLGCLGWSNGGLLTTVAALQRPELWRAVVAGAPVTDMARFHVAHGARHWIAEFGSPEDERELGVLLRYSPYHNMPDVIEAPAILIYAPAADDRVAAWHGRKMLARWQAASCSSRPILLRSAPQTGHRGGSTLTSTIARYTDILAFFFWQLGMRPPRVGNGVAIPTDAVEQGAPPCRTRP